MLGAPRYGITWSKRPRSSVYSVPPKLVGRSPVRNHIRLASSLLRYLVPPKLVECSPVRSSHAAAAALAPDKHGHRLSRWPCLRKMFSFFASVLFGTDETGRCSAYHLPCAGHMRPGNSLRTPYVPASRMRSASIGGTLEGSLVAGSPSDQSRIFRKDGSCGGRSSITMIWNVRRSCSDSRLIITSCL